MEVLGGEQAPFGGKQVSLGNWVSLFAGGSGPGPLLDSKLALTFDLFFLRYLQWYYLCIFDML